MHKSTKLPCKYLFIQNCHFVWGFASLSTDSNCSFVFSLIKSIQYFRGHPQGVLLVKSLNTFWQITEAILFCPD